MFCDLLFVKLFRKLIKLCSIQPPSGNIHDSHHDQGHDANNNVPDCEPVKIRTKDHSSRLTFKIVLGTIVSLLTSSFPSGYSMGVVNTPEAVSITLANDSWL